MIKKFGNLLVCDNGKIFIPHAGEYPYFYKFNKEGVSDGYKYVRLNGCKDIAVHRLVAKCFVQKKCKSFNVVDHISRVRTQNDASNLRWSNPWLNAINRDNTSSSTFDQEINMWYGCYYCKGKEYPVGFFRTFLESHLAVRKAKRELYKRVEDHLVKLENI